MMHCYAKTLKNFFYVLQKCTYILEWLSVESLFLSIIRQPKLTYLMKKYDLTCVTEIPFEAIITSR